MNKTINLDQVKVLNVEDGDTLVFYGIDRDLAIEVQKMIKKKINAIVLQEGTFIELIKTKDGVRVK